MTKAQASLWKYVLRAGYMRGYTFKRERPVLKFIADFMCQELQLIIEVDGITHTWEETMEKDIIKDMALENIGFKVLRFTDQEVLRSIDDVRGKISDAIDEIIEENGRKLLKD
jgi:very-short-patch-repair endonuclease